MNKTLKNINVIFDPNSRSAKHSGLYLNKKNWFCEIHYFCKPIICKN